MAGIGFKLQKLLAEEVYLSTFKGFFYALIITSGPWLIMVTTLSILSIYSTLILSSEDKLLFSLFIVHVSVVTIIITGTFQLFFIRIFSDRIYTKEREELPNVIMTNLMITTSLTIALSSPIFFIESAFPENVAFQEKIALFGLLIAFNIIWVLMNYLTASDNLISYVKHYCIGSLLGIILAGAQGYISGFSGFLWGFYTGQAYIATVLFYLIVKVYGLPHKISLTMIYKHHQYLILIISGFLLYSGMWIDKFIYWYGPSGQQFTSIFFYHSAYNDVFFIAYLLSTPIMAIFLISMETSFYRSYYTYHERSVYTAPLDGLNRSSEDVLKTVKQSLLNIIKAQGLIVVLGILFSKHLLALLNLPTNLYFAFSVALIGVFFHVLSLIICVVLYYIDLKNENLKIYTLFFILNGILSFIFMRFGNDISGFGYMIASIIVFCMALKELNYSLNNLNYFSFTKQQVPEQKNTSNIYNPSTGGYGRYYIRNGEKVLVD